VANSVEAILPPQIRKTFEQYGVIKPASWPKLDTLVKQITGRKYRYDIQTDQTGTVTARVFAHSQTFMAVDGEPERALARAFHDCLKAVGSSQLAMFGDDDPEEDVSDEGFANSITPLVITRTDSTLNHPPSPSSGPDRFVRTTRRTPDGQVVRFDELTGTLVDEDGAVLDIDPVETGRIRADLQRARG
jgi:hypothetical protein